MRIAGSGMVFSGEHGSDEQSATFPNACVTPDGRWLCAFRAAREKAAVVHQRVLLTWSDDEGRTWADPIEPFPAVPLGGRPGRIRTASVTALSGTELVAVASWVDASNTELPFFNSSTEGLLDTRILLSRSRDAGETWSPPEQVSTAPFDVPVPITGPILLLGSGEWACQFELNKAYEDTNPWRHAPVLLFSKDQGRSWPEHAIPAEDPAMRVYYWDQRPAVAAPGRLLDLFWTYDRVAGDYLRIHASESLDNGRTWSKPWDTGVPGQPCPVFPLSDGSLAMPYVDRTSAPVIKVRRSLDGGRTWPQTPELVLHTASHWAQPDGERTMDEAWQQMTAFAMGLPHSAPLLGGGALVVYYAGEHTDTTSIHWARVE